MVATTSSAISDGRVCFTKTEATTSRLAKAMRLRRQPLPFVLLLAATSFVFPQTGLTLLRGTITDPSGAVVVGTQVMLDSKAIGFHASRTTDSNGQYEFPQIAPGKYTITVN